jgi:hypothetical protein
MKVTIEMALGGMMYIPSLMTISSGLRVILKVLSQQFERLRCWYYWWEGFIMYAIEMASVAWYTHRGKSKAIPVTDHKGCETSRFPHFLYSRFTNGGDAVNPTRRPPFTPSPLPGRFLVLISVRGWFDPRAIVRLKGLGQLKNPMISSGFEPATFRLVA